MPSRQRRGGSQIANEFIHKDVGSSLSEAEYDGIGAHVFNSQATGDILYASSATQLTRLAKGAANTILVMGASIPAWSSTLTSPTITGTGTIGCGAITSTGVLTVTKAGLAASIQNTTDAVSNQVLKLGGGNRGTAADDDNAYVSLMLDDDSETQLEFARLIWVASDVGNAGAATSSDGQLQIQIRRNNSLIEFVNMGYDVNSQGAITWNSPANNIDYTWTTDTGSLRLDGGNAALVCTGTMASAGFLVGSNAGIDDSGSGTITTFSITIEKGIITAFSKLS